MQVSISFLPLGMYPIFNATLSECNISAVSCTNTGWRVYSEILPFSLLKQHLFPSHVMDQAINKRRMFIFAIYLPYIYHIFTIWTCYWVFNPAYQCCLLGKFYPELSAGRLFFCLLLVRIPNPAFYLSICHASGFLKVCNFVAMFT